MAANPFSASFTKTGPTPTAKELAAAMRTGLEQRCLFPLSPNLPGSTRGDLHYHANAVGNPISVKPTPYARVVHLMRRAFKVFLRPWLEMQTHFNHAAVEALEKLHSDLYALQNEVSGLKTSYLNQELGHTGKISKAGLWFNPPVVVQVHDNQPVLVAVTERILEHIFVHTRLPKLPARVLDLGCAESTNAIEMASLGFEVVGMDLRNLPLQHPAFEMIRGDIAHLPFPDASFDVVVSLSTIEHVGLDWYAPTPQDSTDHKVIEEARRVLKPGGRLLLTVPFGRAAQTPVHRVYDMAMLNSLLAPLQRVETSFGVREGDTWSFTTDAARAETADSVQRVSAVALVVAEKN